jgi:hypothetical protein
MHREFDRTSLYKVGDEVELLFFFFFFLRRSGLACLQGPDDRETDEWRDGV